MYMILTYVAIHKLESVGMLASIDETKLCYFLNYLFNQENLEGVLR